MPTLEPRNQSRHSNESRVLIQDVIPYEVAESLEMLQGPGEGCLKLLQHVYWGPGADWSFVGGAPGSGRHPSWPRLDGQDCLGCVGAALWSEPHVDQRVGEVPVEESTA